MSCVSISARVRSSRTLVNSSMNSWSPDWRCPCPTPGAPLLAAIVVGPGLRVVFRGQRPAALQAARVHACRRPHLTGWRVHHSRERRPHAAGLAPSRDAEVEPFRDEHHASCGRASDSMPRTTYRALPACRPMPVDPQVVDICFTTGRHGSLPGQRQAARLRCEALATAAKADPPAALQQPAHAIDGRVQQPAVGRELLQRADAAGGPDDRHEVARRDLPVDVARQHRPHVDRALERQAADRRRRSPARGAGPLDATAAAGERPRRCRRRSRPSRGVARRLRRRGGAPAYVTGRRTYTAWRTVCALAALDDLEVGGLQVGDVMPLVVGDHRVERGETDTGAERGLVRRRSLGRTWRRQLVRRGSTLGRRQPARRTRCHDRRCISALRSRPTATPAGRGPCPTAAPR